MRYLFFLFFIISFSAQSQVAQHCGYDFTSYFVLDVHEPGKKENVQDLKISIVNAFGMDLINVNNMYTWTNSNQPLVFMSNYKIDDDNKRITKDSKVSKERWFFPFAKDNYLLSIKSTFPADDYFIKIEDVDGSKNGGEFKTQIVKLNSFNMYVLCSSKARETQFGPKMNRPMDIVLEKK